MKKTPPGHGALVEQLVTAAGKSDQPTVTLRDVTVVHTDNA